MEMNIAFISYNIDSNMGGVGLGTINLANNVKLKFGSKVYLFYDQESKMPPTIYDGKFKISENIGVEDIKNFLTINKIKIVIDQGVININYKIFRDACDFSNCKLISCIRSKPDLIRVFPSYRSLFWDLRKVNLIDKSIVLLKIILFPIYKKYSNNKFIKWKRDLYDNSDKVVVLSKYYIENFVNLLQLKDSAKVTSIGNPLRFDTFFDKEKLKYKTNEVLIVSRLSESDKYLSRLFYVWKQIEKDNNLSHWKLTIVGGGSDEIFYKRLVKKLNLKNVFFEGVHFPLEYYQRAKLFFMSSAHEGFGTTLIESQQMGVPIIAFDNFESLKELVIDGYNGYVVGPKDINSFVQRTKELMLNDDLRITFAKNAINHSKNYTIDKILAKWENLFNELMDEEN